jgi:hypothetical protein
VTGDEYVAAVLRKHAVDTSSGSPAETAARSTVPAIRRWAGIYLADILLSGSYSKGTATRLGTDIDLFISVASNTPGSLKEIYENLFALCSEQGWSPRRQNVSIGVRMGGVDVDLTPGRLQNGYRDYHSIYRRRGDTWTQTNVSLHIDTVRASGRADEIRAIKIWRHRHSLDFPSFFLELAVIEALKGKQRGTLAANVLSALQFIGEEISRVRLVDPANTNNVVSDELTLVEKNSVAACAVVAGHARTWEEILW